MENIVAAVGYFACKVGIAVGLKSENCFLCTLQKDTLDVLTKNCLEPGYNIAIVAAFTVAIASASRFKDELLDAIRGKQATVRQATQDRTLDQALNGSNAENANVGDKILKLAKLHADGMISDDEFKTLKTKLISEMSPEK